MTAKQLARVFKALAHPNRVKLYLEIARQHQASFEAGHECYVADIMKALNIGAPTVSHHLKELADAGLIETERRGKFLVARIQAETVAAVQRALALEPPP